VLAARAGGLSTAAANNGSGGVFLDVARTGAVAFAGTQFTPRT
jgi:hypothetical protein